MPLYSLVAGGSSPAQELEEARRPLAPDSADRGAGDALGVPRPPMHYSWLDGDGGEDGDVDEEEGGDKLGDARAVERPGLELPGLEQQRRQGLLIVLVVPGALRRHPDGLPLRELVGAQCGNWATADAGAGALRQIPRPSSVPSQTLVAFFAGDDHFSSVSGASLQQPPRSRALHERQRRRTPGVGCQRPVLPAAYCSTSQLTMARTINSLMYKGSIPDAINQSRREKKLFVVYISGEDEALSNLEQSTLIDENVVEVIGRCCILLHLKQGNVDASQFSAIYPQKSVPSISVIGLNGVLLWNHEGYINSENLKESIEKAWAALHLQETAATLLTASLASRNAESVNTATTVLVAQGVSSTLENPSDSSSQSPDVSGASGVAHSTDLVSQVPSSTTLYEPLEINEKEGSKSDSGDRTVEKLGSTNTEFNCDLVDSSRKSNTVSSADPKGEDITPSAKRKNKDDGSHTSVPLEDTPSTVTNRGVSSQSLVEQDKATTSGPPLISVQSDDIQLSIRMPSGNRLEIKVTKQDVLRKVKNFVDENKGNELGSYDLSLVYPKRVFSEQDMEATLSELGIQNRHAMIVVPHRQPGQVTRPQSSASYDVGGNSGAGGYFGYLRTVLSYVNPLSYLRGNTNPSNPEYEGLQQLRHGSGQPRPLVGNRGHEVTDADSANTLRRRPRPFGASVHTLGSEDHGPSDERNVFWNGNSTEFGGDDRK